MRAILLLVLVAAGIWALFIGGVTAGREESRPHAAGVCNVAVGD